MKRYIILTILTFSTFPLFADHLQEINSSILASDRCDYFHVGYYQGKISWISGYSIWETDLNDGSNSYSRDSISLYFADLGSGKIIRKVALLDRNNKTGNIFNEPTTDQKKSIVKDLSIYKKELIKYAQLPEISESADNIRSDPVSGWEFVSPEYGTPIYIKKNNLEISLDSLQPLQNKLPAYALVKFIDVRKIDNERFLMYINVTVGNGDGGSSSILAVVIKIMTDDTVAVENLFDL